MLSIYKELLEEIGVPTEEFNDCPPRPVFEKYTEPLPFNYQLTWAEERQAIRATRCYTPYKRVTHFMERLKQVMGINSDDLPLGLIQHVDHLLRDQDKTDPNLYFLVRNVLKQLGQSRHYKSIFYIITRIGGLRLTIRGEVLEAMREYVKKWSYAFDRIYRKHSKTSCLRWNMSVYILLENVFRGFHIKCLYNLPLVKGRAKRKRLQRIFEAVDLSIKNIF